MANDNTIAAELQRFSEELDQDRMSLIDFDRLRETLDAAAQSLREGAVPADDLTLLREDLESRIAGMLKAIVAVDRIRDRRERTAKQVTELKSMSAEALLECYRKVAARFRDHFPTSFGVLRTDVGEHKASASRETRDFR
ncbi:hypothetical protein KQH82_10765 [bacterium]|nr:hypothetical protein [bacterium]